MTNGSAELTLYAQAMSATTPEMTNTRMLYMLLLKKRHAESSGLGPASYAPIANAWPGVFLKMATQNQIWLATVATQTISLISKSGCVF